MMKNAMSLKARIRNYAKERNMSTQLLFKILFINEVCEIGLEDSLRFNLLDIEHIR